MWFVDRIGETIESIIDPAPEQQDHNHTDLRVSDVDFHRSRDLSNDEVDRCSTNSQGRTGTPYGDDADSMSATASLSDVGAAVAPTNATASWLTGLWNTIEDVVDVVADTLGLDEDDQNTSSVQNSEEALTELSEDVVAQHIATTIEAHRRLSAIIVDVMRVPPTNPPNQHRVRDLQNLLPSLEKLEKSLTLLSRATNDADRQRMLQWHITLCKMKRADLSSYIDRVAAGLTPSSENFTQESEMEPQSNVHLDEDGVIRAENVLRSILTESERDKWSLLMQQANVESKGITSQALERAICASEETCSPCPRQMEEPQSEHNISVPKNGSDDWVLVDE